MLMLGLCPTGTPRAHQLIRQQQQSAARPGAGALLLPRSVLARVPSSSSSSLRAPVLRPARRLSTPSALPHGAERGDGVIPSAAAASGAAAAAATSIPAAAAAARPTPAPTPMPTLKPPSRLVPLAPPPPIVTPDDLLKDFEHKLQGDVKAVGTTITAITGVIVFWRGVWSLLDALLGDSIFGDIACIAVGLMTVLAIRLSGAKLSSFWPTS